MKVAALIVCVFTLFSMWLVCLTAAQSEACLHAFNHSCHAGYIAPEVIRGIMQPSGDPVKEGCEDPNHHYGPPCDLWSAGIVLYMLLSGGSLELGAMDSPGSCVLPNVCTQLLFLSGPFITPLDAHPQCCQACPRSMTRASHACCARSCLANFPSRTQCGSR